MTRRTDRALIRPAPVSRIAAAVLTAGISFVIFAMSATLPRVALLWIPLAMSAMCGIMWNAVRNQGTWVFPGAVVLEAVMGRAVIPLGEIVEVHIDEAMTTLGVQTSTHYVVQSIVTPATLGAPDGARARTDRLLSDRNLRCVWHASLADVYAVAASTSPFMWPGAVLATLGRPLVWGTALAGLAWGLYLGWWPGAV